MLPPKTQVSLTFRGGAAVCESCPCLRSQRLPKSHQLQLEQRCRCGSTTEIDAAFYGCYDWHSSVHGHGLRVRLLSTFPAARFVQSARKAQRQSLTAENIVQEAAYFRGQGRSSSERPYGLAWLVPLVLELCRWMMDKEKNPIQFHCIHGRDMNEPAAKCWPGCTVAPHPSQSIISSASICEMEPIATTRCLTAAQYEDRQFALCDFPLRSARSIILHAARGSEQTKRPPGNRATSSFSRENSSNRGFRFRRNFLPKSYGPKKGGVKRFLSNKCLCCQPLT